MPSIECSVSRAILKCVEAAVQAVAELKCQVTALVATNYAYAACGSRLRIIYKARLLPTSIAVVQGN